MTTRTKSIIGGIITVVVVAAAIFIGQAFSASRHPTPPQTVQLSPAQQSQQAYQDGLKALSSEETSTAVLLFQQSLRLDSGNDAAQASLDALTEQQPAPPVVTAAPPTTETAKPAAADPFDKTIDVEKLLPTEFAGYSIGVPQVLGGDASVTGDPNNQGTGVTNVVWAVHDRKTGTAAQKFLDTTRAQIYSHDNAPVTIKGVKGQFGTDGTLFAWTAYRRGRYVFEVTVTSASGSPASLQATTEQAAAAFPTKP